MKKVLLDCIGIFVLLLVIFSCNKDDNRVAIKIEKTGTVKDREGNEYSWVQIGQQQWTTENARASTPFFRLLEPPYFDDHLIIVNDTVRVKLFYGEYGNLYAYDDAIANAPEGWHLPSDQEWMELEKTLGMSDQEVNSIGWRGHQMNELLMDPKQGSQLNLKLGGIALKKGRPFSLQYMYFKDYGYYWTSTVVSETAMGKNAYFRKLVTGSDKIGRYMTNVNDLFMSVRYVKNIN